MTVTEFALIRLQPNINEQELYDTLFHLLAQQDKWVRENQPHLLPADTKRNLTTAFTSKTDDAAHMLLVAPWDSPEGHHAWMGSDVNQGGMASFAKYIGTGDGAVTLFHTDTAGERYEGASPPPEFWDKPGSFDVSRIQVPGKQERVHLQGRFVNVEKELGQDGELWAGWRIERTEDGAEELVVFSSHDNAALASAVRELGSAQHTESYHFHRLVDKNASLQS